MANHNSTFDGLWIDLPNALEITNESVDKGIYSVREGELLEQFINDGFVVLDNAVSDALVDQLLHEIAQVSEYPDYFIARRQRQAYSKPTKEVVGDVTFRLIDFHANSVTAQEVIYAPLIKRFLDMVFQAPPIGFQSLLFIYGSQQGIHQDGAYVAVQEPLKFVASWIALEDVKPGTGELIYFPGSHRFEDYLFSGEHKSWKPVRDGKDAGPKFIKSLWEKIRERSIEKQHFCPKKGDALIWAADLIHGGAKIQEEHTRRSLVTHYCPNTTVPNYKTFSDNYATREITKDGYISSRHYDMGKNAKKDLFEDGCFSQLLKPTFMGA